MTSPSTGSTTPRQPPPTVLVPPTALTPPETRASFRSGERRISSVDAAYLIDRSAEANRLADCIVNASSRIVVLHGQPASGKSTLVKRWLIPALHTYPGLAGRYVYYAASTTELPTLVQDGTTIAALHQALSQPTVTVIDGFDQVLEAPRDTRTSELDVLFSLVSTANAAAKLVLVVDVRDLTQVYSLTAYDPTAATSIEAIRSVEFAEGLRRLGGRPGGDGGVAYTYEALAKLELEAKELHLDPTFDFLKLVHARLRGLLTDTQSEVVGVEQCDMVGGLEGILRDYLEGCIDSVEESQPGTGQLAHAVLVAVHELAPRGAALDRAALARRYEAPEAVVSNVLMALAEPSGPIVGTPEAPVGLQPPQLASVLEADSVALQSKSERARRVVEEALRGWRTLGTPMPANRLAEIHAQRHDLVLDAELTRFLAQCALRVDAPGLGDPAGYWLSRIPDDDAVDVLLAALFEGDVGVRQRAARALAHWPDARVRERLCVVALSDEAPSVRTAAVESLRNMTDDGLLAQLRSEAQSAQGARRVNAVYALRLFPRQDVAECLRGFVDGASNPLDVRQEAVRSLAAIAMPAAVDALVDVALEDADPDDRHAAADALASLPTPALCRQLLGQLRWRRPTGRIIVVALFLAGLSLFGVAFSTGLASVMADDILWFYGALVVFTIATGLLVSRVASGRIRARSPIGFLSLACFTVCTVTVIPFVHGLAHLMVKQKQRALLLFCIELCAIALMGLAFSIRSLDVVWAVYLGVAAAVFAGSYLYDTLAVMLRTFILPRPLTREARRSAILRRAMRNPVMTMVVLENAVTGEATDRWHARSLIRRYGKWMAAAAMVDRLAATDAGPAPAGNDPTMQATTAEQRAPLKPLRDALSRAKDDTAIARLAELWTTSTTSTRHLIARVLERQPTEHAASTLADLAEHGGLALKAHALIAGVRYRFAVWPLLARAAALVLAPAVAILIYHGVQIIRHPEWGLILRLRQPVGLEESKAKIIDLLVDQFPDGAAPEIRRMFVEGRRQEIGPVQAAVVRGLVTLADHRIIRPTGTDLGNVAREMPRFDSLLYGHEEMPFYLSAGVLGTMARSSDTGLANSALRSLKAAADSTAKMISSTSDRMDTLASEIGRLEFDRSLPVLGGMLHTLNGRKTPARSDAKTADFIRLTMVEVADHAYARLPTDGAIPDKKRLRDALERWVPYQSAGLVAQLEADIHSDSSTTCANAAGVACDALRAIARRPDLEDGYRDLIRHYAADSQFVRADSAFTSLSETHAGNVWPRKILSEIEHENLAPTDPRYFMKSYDDALIVQRLPAYQAMVTQRATDYRRIQTDYAEVALSAGKYADLQRVADKVLSTSPSPTEQLNMTLFLYMASVMARDADSATARLTRLNEIVDSLPPQFNNAWEYPGTRAFILQSGLPPAMKKGLLDLCREGAWYPRADAARVIQENRQALGSLSSK